MKTHKELKYELRDWVVTNTYKQGTRGWIREIKEYEECPYLVQLDDGDLQWYEESSLDPLELAPLKDSEEDIKKVCDCGVGWKNPGLRHYSSCRSVKHPDEFKVEPTPPSQIEQSLRDMYELGQQHGRRYELMDYKVWLLTELTDAQDQSSIGYDVLRQNRLKITIKDIEDRLEALKELGKE